MPSWRVQRQLFFQQHFIIASTFALDISQPGFTPMATCKEHLTVKFSALYANIRDGAFRCLLCKVEGIYIMYAGTWNSNYTSCDTGYTALACRGKDKSSSCLSPPHWKLLRCEFKCDPLIHYTRTLGMVTCLRNLYFDIFPTPRFQNCLYSSFLS
jgi:hypothetical protein